MDYAINSDSNDMTDEQRAVMGQVAEAVGYSFSDPIFNEQGEEDMDASRRVAIKFFIKLQ